MLSFRPKAPNTMRLTEANRAIQLSDLRQFTKIFAGVEDVRQFGDRLHLRIRSGCADPVIKVILEAFPVSDGMRVEARLFPPSLEDIFISLLEDSAHASQA